MQSCVVVNTSILSGIIFEKILFQLKKALQVRICADYGSLSVD